jgi:hypothetical protein
MRFPSVNSNFPKTGDIWKCYESITLSINKRFEAAKLNLAAGLAIAEPELAGLSLSKLSDFFNKLQDEADQQAAMFLIASAEAEMRINFWEKVRKGKGNISKKFRNIAKEKHKQKSRNIRLDDEILDVWTDNSPSAKKSVGDFKGALRFRHWLAHGRWWQPKLGQKYDPAGIYALIEELFTELSI